MDTELKARDLSKIELQEYYLDLKKVLDEIVLAKSIRERDGTYSA